MKLLCYLLALLLQQYLIQIDLLKPLNSLAWQLHHGALGIITKYSTHYDWFYAAILFGEDLGLRQKPEIKSFIVIGLYHIIVVSGSHLIILEKIISKIFIFLPIKIKKLTSFVFLFIFTAANLFQPACLRSFLQWVFQNFFKKYFNHATDLILFTIITCLILQPQLISSLSFHLSCAATLGLQISSELKLKKLGQSFLCILLTSPFVFMVQPCLSWIILPANIIALPIFEITVLPFSLLMFFIPLLRTYSEFFLKNLFSLTQWFASFNKPEVCMEQERIKWCGFLLLLLLYLVWRFLLVVVKRDQFKRAQT